MFFLSHLLRAKKHQKHWYYNKNGYTKPPHCFKKINKI